LSTSIAWAIYDPYITRILEAMLSRSAAVARWSAALIDKHPRLLDFAASQGENVGSASLGFTLVPLFIGIVMTFDNIFGVIFQPAFGRLSDRTHSRFGKRRPFIFIFAPVSALVFAFIPWTEQAGSLPLLMACVVLFVLSMSLWRAPVVALMPDLTPPALRSEGNAVINLCGGLGSLVGMAAGMVLVRLFRFDSDRHQEFPWVFLLGSLVMLASVFVLYFFVKEPDSRLQSVAQANQIEEEKTRLRAERLAKKEGLARLRAIKLTKSERMSLVFMLAGLFFLFCGTNAILTFFSLFAGEVLGKTTAQATIMMAVFAACSMAAALPSGKLGKKIGRKPTILLGLGLFVLVFLLYKWTGSAQLVWVALVLGGAANMMITVNTLPLVLEIGGLERVGAFTGYYYTATFSAQIAAPILFGVMRMFSGTYLSLFTFSPVAFALAVVCILFVRHGEAVPENMEPAASRED
jgi:Na+/melibiose symporter-like transporter